MTWTSLTFSFGATLTSTQMNQLQQNIAALGANDSGSPTLIGRVISFANGNESAELDITGVSGTNTLISLGSVAIATGQAVYLFGSITAYIEGFDGETFTTMNFEVVHNGSVIETIDAEPIFTKMKQQGEQTITVGFTGYSAAVDTGTLLLRLSHAVSSMTTPNLLMYSRTMSAKVVQES